MTEEEKLALLCHIAENYGVDQELIVDIVKNFLESKVSQFSHFEYSKILI
jgi:hypothetical protein